MCPRPKCIAPADQQRVLPIRTATVPHPLSASKYLRAHSQWLFTTIGWRVIVNGVFSMPQQNCYGRITMDRRHTSGGKHRLLPVVAAAALLLAGSAAWAREDGGDNGAVKLLKTVPVPPVATNAAGGLYAFDISFIDPHTHL